ncbi:FapA family protein [Gracilibacillus halophilus]|uniref:FapA family protein n=1 Tax=Gracilibacillus halophilus TaxID=470864 RepID=UPI0003A312F6|nr:FapA family protein [Gracilibacillus halophilus]
MKDEEIPAKDGYPLQVIASEGTQFVADNIMATEAGRPVIEQRGRTVKTMVMSRYVHQGNVNIKSGNIKFNGDVEIVGEVEENMKVEAGGDIYIHQAISESTITASKSIISKGNVLQSMVTAGKHNLLVIELGNLLRIMEKQLSKMLTIIQQMMGAKAYKQKEFETKGLQPLIIILLERKFIDFRTYAQKYVDIINKGSEYIDEEDWMEVSEELQSIFLVLSNQKTTLGHLHHLQETMNELAETTKEEVEPNSYVTVSSATNSTVYSSGNVNIVGKGCINTKVHAGGKLVIQNVLRGGEVFGRLGVSVAEAGAVSGTKTIISTTSDYSITISHAYEGTVLRIGEATRQLTREEYNIKAVLGDDEEIVIR